MSLTASFLAAVVALTAPQGVETPYCSLAAETSLEQPVDAFEDGPGGWRRWGEGGCKTAAADLIAAYRGAHAQSLRRDDRVMLSFHEAQLRASENDYASASALLRSIDGAAASPATALYYDATLAFLQSDLESLREIRARLAALPVPPGFERARADYIARYGGEGPEWPLNIGVVDGLVRCFGQPYTVAYSCPAQP